MAEDDDRREPIRPRNRSSGYRDQPAEDEGLRSMELRAGFDPALPEDVRRYQAHHAYVEEAIRRRELDIVRDQYTDEAMGRREKKSKRRTAFIIWLGTMAVGLISVSVTLGVQWLKLLP